MTDQAPAPLREDLHDGQWRTFGRFVRGGWFSALAWVCVLVVLVNGVIAPIWRLTQHFEGQLIDWMGLATVIPVIAALAHYRSKNLRAGVTT